MCIAVISTAHPLYKFIIINNRDEYLNRPTAVAEWWPAPHDHIFGGRDLLRDVQGTWLGITRTGKIAVLTNYRESNPPPPMAVSRGAIIRKFLAEDFGPVDEFVRNVVSTGIARDAGGFSLVCGVVGQKLAVISNRASDQSEVPWIAGDSNDAGETVGLSNAAFTDRSWPKVTVAEEMMLEAIKANVAAKEGEQGLIDRLLAVLHHDTLPRLAEGLADGSMTAYLPLLPKSILIPPLGRKNDHHSHNGPKDTTNGSASTSTPPPPPDHHQQQQHHHHHHHQPGQRQLGVDGVYATQKESVILVGHDGRVRFFERTLYDADSNPIPLGKGDVDEQFYIQ